MVYKNLRSSGISHNLLAKIEQKQADFQKQEKESIPIE